MITVLVMAAADVRDARKSEVSVERSMLTVVFQVCVRDDRQDLFEAAVDFHMDSQGGPSLCYILGASTRIYAEP